MGSTRRGFLTGGLAVGSTVGAGCRTGGPRLALNQGPDLGDWAAVRSEFLLSRDHIHLALMLVTSHPRPVREAIERHRRALDENPSSYFEEKFFNIEGEVRAAAAQYMGGAPEDIALTDSTTMALAVLYGGLPLRPGQQVLTTTHDHYATHENLRLAAARAGGGAKSMSARLLCTTSRRPLPRRRSSAGWWPRSSRAPGWWPSPGCTHPRA